MKMTKEQQALVTDNIKFIYWLSNNMSRSFTSFEKDELLSIVMECFTASAIKYDSSHGCSYIQYAKKYTCNRIIDEVRKQNVRAKYSLTICHSEKAPPPDPADENFDLHQAIASLPERSRDVINDYYYNGLSQAEIALKHGLSRPSINEILRQSRETIKEKIA